MNLQAKVRLEIHSKPLTFRNGCASEKIEYASFSGEQFPLAISELGSSYG